MNKNMNIWTAITAIVRARTVAVAGFSRLKIPVLIMTILVSILAASIVIDARDNTTKVTNYGIMHSNMPTKSVANVDYSAIQQHSDRTVAGAYSETAVSERSERTGDAGLPATFSMIDKKVYDFKNSGWKCSTPGLPIASSCWQSITNYSFDLPYSSYVTVESSGLFSGYNGQAGVELAIDQSNPCSGDIQTMRLYNGEPIKDYFYAPAMNNYSSSETSTGFQTSGTYYLAKGKHTIYLNGLATINQTEDDPNNSLINNPTISFISMTAIANSQGNIQIKN